MVADDFVTIGFGSWVLHSTKVSFYLSDITKLPRELTQKDTAWPWDHLQQHPSTLLRTICIYTLQEEIILGRTVAGDL